MDEERGRHVLYTDFTEEFPLITRGEGVYLFDDKEKKYLDAISGVGAVILGYGVQEIIEAMVRQARTLPFTYDVANRPREQLASGLQGYTPEEMGETKTLFMSGGAEANEGALKVAYQYHYEGGHPTKRKIISRWQSYHGNTIGALSMSGRTQWRKMFSPLLLDFPHIQPPYCYRCPYHLSYGSCQIECAYALERVILQEGPENVGAFLAEPIIGTSLSAVVPPKEYYPIISEICKEYDLLFIVDEVMSGVGRTGEFFAIDHWGVTPDIITLAKGISGGYSPLAALILGERVWRAVDEGSRSIIHSYTYGGNPLSCAVGVAVLDYLEEHDLIREAGLKGERLLEGLKVLEDLEHVGEVRGKGLFIGIELVLDKETKEPFPIEDHITHGVVKEAFSRGLLIMGGVLGSIDGVKGDHLELIPPYTISNRDIDSMVEILKESIMAVTEKH